MNITKKLVYTLVSAIALQAAVPAHASIWSMITSKYSDIAARVQNMSSESKRTIGFVAAGIAALTAVWFGACMYKKNKKQAAVAKAKADEQEKKGVKKRLADAAVQAVKAKEAQKDAEYERIEQDAAVHANPAEAQNGDSETKLKLHNAAIGVVNGAVLIKDTAVSAAPVVAEKAKSAGSQALSWMIEYFDGRVSSSIEDFDIRANRVLGIIQQQSTFIAGNIRAKDYNSARVNLDFFNNTLLPQEQIIAVYNKIGDFRKKYDAIKDQRKLTIQEERELKKINDCFDLISEAHTKLKTQESFINQYEKARVAIAFIDQREAERKEQQDERELKNSCSREESKRSA